MPSRPPSPSPRPSVAMGANSAKHQAKPPVPSQHMRPGPPSRATSTPYAPSNDVELLSWCYTPAVLPKSPHSDHTEGCLLPTRDVYYQRRARMCAHHRWPRRGNFGQIAPHGGARNGTSRPSRAFKIFLHVSFPEYDT